MQQRSIPRPVSLVSIAASVDANLLEAWEMHLLPLQQAGYITFWSKRRLLGGAPEKEQVLAHLDQASCIIFLLSPDFFDDEECLMSLKHALQRRQTQQVVIIPLLVRPVAWQETEIGAFPCLPASERPVSLWTDRDEAFQTCLQQLCALLHLSARALRRATRKEAHAHADTNRERMLRRLHLRYEQMLSQSLQGAVQIELGLASRPAAVQNEASLSLRLPDQPEQLLPPHTSIVQAYELAQQELLILGNPGAGKSTLLLELAYHLIEQAEQDETQPLPIVLPLSSWATKRSPFQDWLIDLIALLYDIPRRLSQQWVQAEAVLPLLDGLDEMEEVARAGCIAAINTYHREHLHPLVVCSRTNEYGRATTHERLALHTAVVVQPLSVGQVDVYLQHLGKPVAALRTTLRKNVALQELASTPLLLQVMMLTYHGTTIRALPQKEDQLRDQIWTDYIQRVVRRKGDAKRYPFDVTCRWLGFLAQQMRTHNQAVFYLEHLQPDWLDIHQQRIYSWLAIRLPAITIGALISILVSLFFSGNTDVAALFQYGVIGGLLGGIWRRPEPKQEDQSKRHLVQGNQLILHLAMSVFVGFIYGLSFGFYLSPYYTFSKWLIDSFSFGVGIGLGAFILQHFLATPIAPTQFSSNTATQLREWMLGFFKAQAWRALLMATVIWLSIVLGYALSYELSYGLSNRLIIVLSNALDVVLSNALSYILINLVLGSQKRNVHLTERLSWTRKSLFNIRHLSITLLFACATPIFTILSNGVSNGLINGLGSELSDGYGNGVSKGLSLGLSLGLSYWFTLGVSQGISQERIEDKDRHIVNQGIYRSWNNSVRIGIIGGLLIGAIGILSIVLSYGLSYILSWGILWGQFGGLGNELSNGWNNGQSYLLPIILSGIVLIYLLTGGLAVWRHYVIRFILWHSHIFPILALRFLDDVTARILLQRFGGGYRFTHRLLLDHFADLEAASTISADLSTT